MNVPELKKLVLPVPDDSLLKTIELPAKLALKPSVDAFAGDSPRAHCENKSWSDIGTGVPSEVRLVTDEALVKLPRLFSRSNLKGFSVLLTLPPEDDLAELTDRFP